MLVVIGERTRDLPRLGATVASGSVPGCISRTSAGLTKFALALASSAVFEGEKGGL